METGLTVSGERSSCVVGYWGPLQNAMTNEGPEMGCSALLSISFQDPAVLPEWSLAAAGGEASWEADAVGPGEPIPQEAEAGKGPGEHGGGARAS